jgi:hypothetical protein
MLLCARCYSEQPTNFIPSLKSVLCRRGTRHANLQVVGQVLSNSFTCCHHDDGLSICGSLHRRNCSSCSWNLAQVTLLVVVFVLPPAFCSKGSLTSSGPCSYEYPLTIYSTHCLSTAYALSIRCLNTIHRLFTSITSQCLY